MAATDYPQNRTLTHICDTCGPVTLRFHIEATQQDGRHTLVFSPSPTAALAAHRRQHQT